MTVKLPQGFGENRSTHEPILETLKNCAMGKHLEYNSAKLGSNKEENQTENWEKVLMLLQDVIIWKHT